MPDPIVPQKDVVDELNDEILEDQEANIQGQEEKEEDERDDIAGAEVRSGGFAEENVTPQVIDDMWATDQDKAKNSNLITGETFLKDARQIDQSIEDMRVVSDTVAGLTKPYNDDEMAIQPENVGVFA